MTEKKTRKVRFPPKLVPVLDLSAHVPYRGSRGGRGSGKTKSFARASAYAMDIRNCNILVCREIQASIKDSSFAEIKDAIEDDEYLNSRFDCGINYIRHLFNGKEFIFRGLKNNISAIKSLANIGITWVDEADPVSENSWAKLIPTVRRFPKSEIWLTWNPEVEDNATDRRFVQNPPKDSRIVELNYGDNPWFPEGLEEERQRDLSINPDTYAHVWEGDYLRNSDAEIFANKWQVEAFEPENNWQVYYGLDFGFSQDPTACLQVYMNKDLIYVRKESGKVGLELDNTADYLKRTMPEIHNQIVSADCARPESISYLKRNGLSRIRSCKKWQGSVEDGISFIRKNRGIVVHPDCKELIRELKLYRYKVNPNTDEVTDKIVDAHNHYLDALRYALDKLITNKGYTIHL